MAKKKSVQYFTTANDILDHPLYKRLSDKAKVYYSYLCKNENIFSDGNQFYRSNTDMAKDLGWSIDKVKRAKAELVKSGFVEINIGESGKTKKITFYYIHETTDFLIHRERQEILDNLTREVKRDIEPTDNIEF